MMPCIYQLCSPNQCHITFCPIWLNTLKQTYLLTITGGHFACATFQHSLCLCSFLPCPDQKSREWSCIIFGSSWDSKCPNVELLLPHPTFFFFFVKFLFWVCIWKHLSLNGPLVHLQTISSESQKELGHPTIHGHMQKGGIEGSGRGESRILSQTIEWLHELTLKRICRKALCKESINPKLQIPIYRGNLTEFGDAGWGLLVCCFLIWS